MSTELNELDTQTKELNEKESDGSNEEEMENKEAEKPDFSNDILDALNDDSEKPAESTNLDRKISDNDEYEDGERVSDVLKRVQTDRRPTFKVKNQEEFIEHVLSCCTAENGFDIYQLMAFDSDTKSGWKDWTKYIFNSIKSILCVLTQIFGIIIIMVDFIQLGLETKEWCNPPDYENGWRQILYDSNLKLLSFLFSSFLAYFSVDALMGVESGMYNGMDHAVELKWVNTNWLRIGFTVNVFVSIIAVYGSFLVIFFSDNSLDMVLNSVALFFIVELDDLLVKQADYERVELHVLEALNPSDSEDAKKDEDHNKESEKKCEKCCKCYEACKIRIVCCIGWLYTLPFQIIRYVTVVVCMVLPFWVGYCY